MSRETLTAVQCVGILERTADYLVGVKDNFVCDLLSVSMDVTGTRPLAALHLVTPDETLASEAPGKDYLCAGDYAEGLILCNYAYAGTTWLEEDPNFRPIAATAVRALGSVASKCPLPIYRAAGTLLDNPDTSKTTLGIEAQAAENLATQDRAYAFLMNRGATEKSIPNRYSLDVMETTGPGKRYFYTVNFDILQPN